MTRFLLLVKLEAALISRYRIDILQQRNQVLLKGAPIKAIIDDTFWKSTCAGFAMHILISKDILDAIVDIWKICCQHAAELEFAIQDNYHLVHHSLHHQWYCVRQKSADQQHVNSYEYNRHAILLLLLTRCSFEPGVDSCIAQQSAPLAFVECASIYAPSETATWITLCLFCTAPDQPVWNKLVNFSCAHTTWTTRPWMLSIPIIAEIAKCTILLLNIGATKRDCM